MKEASLNKDSFGNNIMYANEAAMMHQLYRLYIMKKNTDPLNPDKGCDINSYYYENIESSVLSSLENIISDQVSTYTPYSLSSVSCKAIRNKEGKYILHVISTMYNYEKLIVFSTDGTSSSIQLVNK